MRQNKADDMAFTCPTEGEVMADGGAYGSVQEKEVEEEEEEKEEEEEEEDESEEGMACSPVQQKEK